MPSELFSDDGHLKEEFKRFCPPAELCMSRNPHKWRIDASAA
jgi:hypothetical protein